LDLFNAQAKLILTGIAAKEKASLREIKAKNLLNLAFLRKSRRNKKGSGWRWGKYEESDCYMP
jgi:hypothetical protein